MSSQKGDVKIINQNAPLITLGAKFEAKTDAEKISHLHKVASSSNQALDMMQQDRDRLYVELQVAKALSENADNALNAQKMITQAALEKQNLDSQHVAQRIAELQAELQQFRQLKKMLRVVMNGNNN